MQTKKQNKKDKNDLFNSISIVVIIAIVIAIIYSVSGIGFSSSPIEAPLSELKHNYDAELLDKIEIEGNKIYFTLKDGSNYFAIKESGATLKDMGMDSSKINVNVVDTTKNRLWIDIAISVVPIFLIFLFLIFIFKQAQGSSNSAFSFGKSKAKLFEESDKKSKITFANVAGVKEPKEELKEIVDFLKSPKKYLQIGAKIPRGVIMFGPPGTGKTLLARAVAGEANVPFFSISGSEFVEMFVGVGASRVRDLFSKAKKNAPCIIFIDEIDAVGRHRGAGLGGGHDEREQTLNQILVEMDGFDNETNVIVMAASNRPDILDPAILRPGRFDRRIVIDLPDIEDREDILKVHSRNKPFAEKIDLGKIAKQTPGFSGADLANLMNEAAILTAKHDLKKITMNELEKSVEKVLLGPERKSKVLSKEEREVTAYHEAGHAITAHFLKHCDPVHKISIISRGRALGVTWYMPEKDLHLHTKSKFEDDLSALLGGRVAEEIIFSEVTTGASNDLKRATSIARKMVTEFGMSKKLGLRVYGHDHGSVFLGREISSQKNYSENVASIIDDEVAEIINDAYNVTVKILKKNLGVLKKVGKELLKKENISREEFIKLINGKEVKSKKQ